MPGTTGAPGYGQAAAGSRLIPPGTWVLAVDFGSTNTKAAIADAHGTTALMFGGRPVMPSAALLTGGTATWLTGDDAIRDAHLWPSGFEPNPKGQLSRLVAHPAGFLERLTGAISAVLRAITETAAAERGNRRPSAFVLTHPPGISATYQSVLRSAARRAAKPDWPQPQFLSEPVAAAQTILDRTDVPQQARLVVLDLGGGTVNATVVDRNRSALAVVAQWEDARHVDMIASVGLASDVLSMAPQGPPFVGVLLTGGGATRPGLAALAGERTGRPPLRPDGDPVTAIARGAALWAYRALASPGTLGITILGPGPDTTGAPAWGSATGATPPAPGPEPGSAPGAPPMPGPESAVFGSRSGPTAATGGTGQMGPPEKPAPRPAVDQDVRFTVYRPEVLCPGRWASLLVFTHKTGLITEPGGTPVDPVRLVEARASAHFGGRAPRPAAADARHGLTRGTQLRIVPELPGILCNPGEVLVHWWEPVHEAAFRLRAGPELAGKVVRGAVRVWCGPLIFGEVSIALRIEPAPTAGEPSPVPTPISPYRRIFPSYSHRDRRVVAVFAEAARALGDQYLQDVLALRSGERWNSRLLELIEVADVFQLFWSHNSMRSQYCQQEWEHALTLRRPAFVRPLYWEDPMPADPGSGLPPATLRELHFVRVPMFGSPAPSPAGPEPARPAGGPPPTSPPPSQDRPDLVWKHKDALARPRRVAVRAAALVLLLAALVYVVFQFVIR